MPTGYDRIEIPNPSGESRYLTPAQFEDLPLPERVKLLMGGGLRFFRKGEEIPAREVLRGA